MPAERLPAINRINLSSTEDKLRELHQEFLNHQPIFSYLPTQEDLIPPQNLMVILTQSGADREEVTTWYQNLVLQEFEKRRSRWDRQLAIIIQSMGQIYSEVSASIMSQTIKKSTEIIIKYEDVQADKKIQDILRKEREDSEFIELFPKAVEVVSEDLDAFEKTHLEHANAVYIAFYKSGALIGSALGATLVYIRKYLGSLIIGTYEFGKIVIGTTWHAIQRKLNERRGIDKD